MNKSPKKYLRLKAVGDKKFIPDRSETAAPRYGRDATVSHRRRDNRFNQWAHYA